MAGTPPNVCMFGTGEYTTGFTDKGASTSDKSTGVVALVMLDLRLRGKIGRLGMCGVQGPKLPAVRAHMASALGGFVGIEPGCIETWPADDVVDPSAFQQARPARSPHCACTIFCCTRMVFGRACTEPALLAARRFE
eukprot:scaffold29403_cov130-Isochrysis_galbana.AAC.2